MRTNRFTVKDSTGTKYTWSFERLQGIYSTLGRRMNGWMLRTHDGCERFSEGNWIDFVPFARLIAANYGMTTDLS